MKKSISLILSILFISLLLVSCGVKGNSNEGNNESIVVVDQLGREVTLKKNPEKIISSYYISTSILISLGVKEKVVGIEAKADTREMYKRVSPEFLDLPAVGSGKEINVEECLKLNPDVVIIPTRLKEFIPQFEKLDIPVVAVEPETLESFNECVKLLGTVTGEDKKAEELLAYYDSVTKKVDNITSKIENKPTVYLGGSDNILKTCTSKMYQNHMINSCGGINTTESLEDGYWATISIEELIKLNPEYIYIVGYANYSIEDVLNDTRLQGIKAIEDKNVYIFPSNLEPWDYPTPSSALGMLWTLNNLHSDKYSTDEFKSDVKAFYKDFYNLDVTDKEIGL